MIRILVAAMILTTCASAPIALAAEHAEHAAPTAYSTRDAKAEPHAESHALPYDHPAIPKPARWAGASVIVILGMFLLAAAVGVGVRMNTPEEAPTTHSHDDAHGAPHHH